MVIKSFSRIRKDDSIISHYIAFSRGHSIGPNSFGLVLFQKTYPLELHLVHFKTEYGSTIGDALTVQATDNLAVLGIMFEIQEKDNPDIKYLIKAIGNQPKPNQSTDMGSVPLADLLPRNTDGFYRYNGSLTTPGCNEVVVWTVFKVSRYLFLTASIVLTSGLRISFVVVVVVVLVTLGYYAKYGQKWTEMIRIDKNRQGSTRIDKNQQEMTRTYKN